jgi:hypothetical protein
MASIRFKSLTARPRNQLVGGPSVIVVGRIPGRQRLAKGGWNSHEFQ